MTLHKSFATFGLFLGSLLATLPAWAEPTPVIKTFTVQQVSALKPGTVLQFKLNGTSEGDVTLAVDGARQPVVMAETSVGNYTGSYTVGLRDQVTYSSKVQATMQLGSQQAHAVLGQTLLTASAQKAAQAAAAKTVSTRQACDTCGVLQSVEEVEVKGEPGYGGMIAGGVAGALLGSQIGKGDGRTAASILGAAGGAYAGREVEKNMKKEKRYNVTVRLNNGSTQTVQMEQNPGLAVGSQVKIVGNGVVSNN